MSGTRRRQLGASAILMAVLLVLKTVVGAGLIVLAVTGMARASEIAQRQDTLRNWPDRGEYAVFYPMNVGDDRADLEQGGFGPSLPAAQNLYPVLDAEGAIYVDATSYRAENLVDRGDNPLSMTVNLNYLARYPILDTAGNPITVAESETDWIVAVPDTLRGQETALRKWFTERRVGGAQIQGAAAYEEQLLHQSVADRFRTQQVRIIWTQPGQRIFSFDTEVYPGEGNTVTDPIVRIMTRENSLVGDRLNGINGDPNGALKVRVDGDAAAVLTGLGPALQEFHLDDNLRTLVATDENLQREIADLQEGANAMTVILCASGALLLLLGITTVVVHASRWRASARVLRLHGVGPARSFRRLWVILVLGAVAQTAVAAGVLGSRAARPGAAAASLDVGAVAAIGAAVLLCELLCALVVVTIVDRRQAVQQLKER